MNVSQEGRRDDAVIGHYSAALDEIYRLRTAAAYERAAALELLRYKSAPVGLRRELVALAQRLELAARGQVEQVADYRQLADTGESIDKVVLRRAGAPTTLTRHAWERRDG